MLIRAKSFSHKIKRKRKNYEEIYLLSELVNGIISSPVNAINIANGYSGALL